MDVIDLVQLPRLTAPGALALAEQTISAAAPHMAALPPTCAASLGALTAAQSVLAGALRSRLGPTAGAELVPFDRAIDSAWSGFHDFLSAFLKLPMGGPLADAAAFVNAAVFADGLKFTLAAYPIEWAESQVRLDHMETPEMALALSVLGAGTFVDAIRTAHIAYGKALGMGAAKTAAQPSAVRPAYLATLQALRLHVVKVIALIEPDQPETKALADALLLPLTTWNVRTGKRTPADADTIDAGDPAEPAADAQPASPASLPSPAGEPAAPSSKPA